MRGKTKQKFLLFATLGFVIGAFLLAGVVWFTSPTLAQVDIDNETGTTFGLGTADLMSTVIRVVQWVLGFLGLIAVIIILYGGFVWMTAAGNAERIEKAKKILIRAVIGLVIILLAWAIVTFVVKNLLGLTGGTSAGGGCAPVGPAGCWECPALDAPWVYHAEWPGCDIAGGASTFRVVDHDPADDEINVPLCSIVQARFNGSILPASVIPGVNVRVVQVATGNAVAGAWQVTGDDNEYLEFDPDADYIENVVYRVVLDPDDDPDDGIFDGVTEVGPGARRFPGKVWEFTTGSTTLATPPTVTQIYPEDAEDQICLNTAVQVRFSSKMRASSINSTTVEFTNADPAGPAAPGLKPFSPSNGYTLFASRPESLLTAGEAYNVRLLAGDPADDTTGIMDVCKNHLDGDYDTTEDGSPVDDFMTVNGQPDAAYVSPWDFQADTDTTNTQCLPEITNLTPSGTYHGGPVIVEGSNIGIGGNLYFKNEVDASSGDNHCFDGAGQPTQACIVNWPRILPTGRSAIDTGVPGGPEAFSSDVPSPGAMDGAVSVEVAGDRSNGWDFDVASPQIRKLSGLNKLPYGGTGQYVSIIKRSDTNAGFGAAVGSVRITGRTGLTVNADFPECSNYWTDSSVVIKLPHLGGIATACAGNWDDCEFTEPDSIVTMQVFTSAGVPSNIVKFVYTNDLPGPGLCEAVPECGIGTTPVQLIGERFNAAAGTVGFTQNVVPPVPPVNAPITNWTDTSINLTVPGSIPNDEYEVGVTRADGAGSNGITFNIPCGDVPRVVENTSCSPACSFTSVNPGASCVDDGDCPGGVCAPLMASPNPYKNADDVCVNAIFGAQFEDANGNPVQMDPATLTGTNIILESCDEPFDTCALPTEETRSIDAIPVTFDGFTMCRADAVGDCIELDPSKHYRVTIRKEVESDAGVRMNRDYVWAVKTKDDAGPCPVETVTVMPVYVPVDTLGATVDYDSYPIGPSCSILNAASYAWVWGTTKAAVATVTGSVTPDETATALGAGSAYIQATAEGQTGQGKLKVDPESCAFNPGKCADPNLDGMDECPGSVCDIVADRCTPALRPPISPTSGPNGQFISVNGCYFGNTPGTLHIGGDIGTLDCSNAWSDRLIVATVPAGVAGNDNLIRVEKPTGRCDGGNNDGTLCDADAECTGGGACDWWETNDPAPNGSAQTDATIYGFDVTDTCAGICNGGDHPNKVCDVNADCPGGGVCVKSLPPDGLNGDVPGICPPLSPAAGRPGTSVTVNGVNFVPETAAINPATSRVYYHDGKEDTYNAISVRGSWLDDAVTNTVVPIDTSTGPASVQVNGCPSNEIDFGVTCTNGSQCSSGCCLSGLCQSTAAACSSGEPGSLCQLPGNPLCTDGNTVSTAAYRCIDTVGHSDPVPPDSMGYPPAADADCRVCCDADQDNDGDTSDDPMMLGSLRCTPDVGNCTDNERGLYCGCTDDVQCGDPANIGCGLDDGRTSHCCYPRPVPFPLVVASQNCTNFVAEFFFTPNAPRMDPDSFYMADTQADSSVWVFDLDTGDPIEVTIKPTLNGFRVMPQALYIPGQRVQIQIDRSRVKNSYGISAGVNDRIMGIYTLNAAAELCVIDHLEFRWIGDVDAGEKNPPAYYRCVADQCEDNDGLDAGNNGSGNERFWMVQAVDKYNVPLTGGVPDSIRYTWDDVSGDPNDIFFASNNAEVPFDSPCPAEQYTSFGCYLRANNHNGRARFIVSADGDGTTFGDLGKATESAPIISKMCLNPWPYPPIVGDPLADAESFEDSALSPKADTITGADNIYTNFSTWYCRDGTDLPMLKPTDEVVIRNGGEGVCEDGTPCDNDVDCGGAAGSCIIDSDKDPLIKQYFFLREGSDDAIGIRVYANKDGKSPQEWYRQQFGPAAPNPQSLKVDGYPAVRSGRSVYVAAPNLVGGVLYSNVYLISYNEAASSETIGIYNKLIDNWDFMVNVDPDDEERLRRDMQRLNDLNDIWLKLLEYKGSHGEFPKLEGGSYIANMSTSRWPSWQETLGRAVGGDLPIDPINEFTDTAECDPADGFNESTCWRETDRSFEAPEKSFLYHYDVNAEGTDATLYTRLEYEDAGSWISGLYDPCAPRGNSLWTCNNIYNYFQNLTGVPGDREGPVITSVDALTAAGPNAVSGTRDLAVVVGDVPSGVAYVEFYVDGILKFTDDINADGWGWIMDSTVYPNRRHTLEVRAFDTVGNRASAFFPLDIDNAGGADGIAPFVRINSPTNGEIVGGANVFISIIASDNQSVSSLAIGYDGPSGVGVIPHACALPTPSLNCTTTWDTTGLINGEYALSVTATDPSANEAKASAAVTVDNPDLVDPVIAGGTINLAPARDEEGNAIGAIDAATGVISGAIDVYVTATDDQGIDRVEFSLDGVGRATDRSADADPDPDAAGQTYAWTWDTLAVTNGLHQLAATARDINGNGSAASLPVTVDNPENDNILPTVEFNNNLTPANGSSIDGIVTIGVLADDDRGVTTVNFYVDYLKRSSITVGHCTDAAAGGCDQKADCGTEQCGFAWDINTLGLSDGWHRIQVDAVDAVGNRSTSIERRYNVRGEGGPTVSDACVWPDSVPPPPPVTDITIEAIVADGDGVPTGAVYASIQKPDETEVATVTLDLMAGDVFNGAYQGVWSPTEAGAYYVDILATDSQGNTSELENISVCGAAPPPPPPPPPPPAGPPVLTEPHSFTPWFREIFNFTSWTLSATNTPQYTAVGLPPGLSLNPDTGVLSGNITRADTGFVQNVAFPVTFTATNVIGSDSFDYYIFDNDNNGSSDIPVPTPVPLTYYTTNVPFSRTFTASRPTTYCEFFGSAGAGITGSTDGALPAGLTFNRATCTLSGSYDNANTLWYRLITCNAAGCGWWELGEIRFVAP